LWTAQVRNTKIGSVDTPARLLRLLVLIASRDSWSADQLADRLGVTTRTVRRDVNRLRSLGYPVESATGPYGGYALGAGTRLPPLLFDDDEAVAAVAGLHELERGPDPSLAAAAMSALTKFRHVLPAARRERVGTLTEMSEGLDRPSRREVGGGANVATLLDVAISCQRSERVRFVYRSGADVETRRHVEPYRLVSAGRRWYLVAFDLDRDDWRTFRVDRIDRLASTGARSSDRAHPDAAALVSEGIAVRVFDTHALIRVHLPRADVERIVPPTVGVVQADGSTETSTMVRIGGEPDWVAGYLLGLPCPFDVLEPDEVRAEVVRQAATIVRRHQRAVNRSPATTVTSIAPETAG
jgi:predicted DNA-binding transcriptional regulator YafY